MATHDEEGRPTIYDYIAASMITILFLWLWGQVANLFTESFEAAPLLVVALATYTVYFLAGTSASYLVLYRTGNSQVSTGIKVGFFTFLATTAYFYMLAGVTMNTILSILFGFVIGGYIGAEVRIRTMAKGMSKGKKDRSESDS